jgi:serine/threonine protein kinase
MGNNASLPRSDNEKMLLQQSVLEKMRLQPSVLEQMLVDETVEPMALPLSLLENITGGFDVGQEIGRGGFAIVYKVYVDDTRFQISMTLNFQTQGNSNTCEFQGILGSKVVAVKRLTNALMDEKYFHREIECLMQVKHKNVVRFLGYCADTQGNMQRHEGRLVMADVRQRLLCFEYISQGSLHNYLKGMSMWHVIFLFIVSLTLILYSLKFGQFV